MIEFQGYRPSEPTASAANGMARAKAAADHFNIPDMYRVPHVELKDHERSVIDNHREQQATSAAEAWPSNRPRKQLYIVSFKCSRVDVFYLLDNTGLHVREGDLVIVEADRGQDLGTVQHAKVAPDAARLLKKKYSEEQYKWLMMYCRNKNGGYNPNSQFNAENNQASAFSDMAATMHGSARDNYNLKPKAIKRLASEHEIRMLAEKEGNEAKAKRTCQQKVAHLRLQMEILDAEWQWWVKLDERSFLFQIWLTIHSGTSRNSSSITMPTTTSTSKTLSPNCIASTRRASGFRPSIRHPSLNMPSVNRRVASALVLSLRIIRTRSTVLTL